MDGVVAGDRDFIVVTSTSVGVASFVVSWGSLASVGGVSDAMVVVVEVGCWLWVRELSVTGPQNIVGQPYLCFLN